MLNYSRSQALAAGLVALLSAGGVAPAVAQSYPIDCAILLCLSGGWPASEPCARARAEFIRRITPWPVEPPLQIWRCPMGASYELDGEGPVRPRLYDILFRDAPVSLPQSRPGVPRSPAPVSAIFRTPDMASGPLGDDEAHRLVQDRADIDISGREFDFVRSIRVYHVRYASQWESGEDDNCNRFAAVQVGGYGTQGDFAWRRASPGALPEAHVGLERWGEDCPGIRHRSVFVDWRDYEGNYGFEQVNY